MRNFLKKLVSGEVIEAVTGRPPQVHPPTSHDPRIIKLRRKLARRRELDAKLKKCTAHIWPPRTGSRRPEWSSAIAGKWSSLNGLPE